MQKMLSCIKKCKRKFDFMLKMCYNLSINGKSIFKIHKEDIFMITRQTYSRSRFASNCEPMTPFRRNYGKHSQDDSKKRRDIYEETSDFCHDLLGDIQEKYDKAIQMSGSKRGILLIIRRNLNNMKEKARRVGIDPEKAIGEYDYSSETKKRILNDIRDAQNIIMLMEISE